MFLKEFLKQDLTVYLALKERMEKDIDEVSKVAQHIKGKIEALDKSVRKIPFAFSNYKALMMSLFKRRM